MNPTVTCILHLNLCQIIIQLYIYPNLIMKLNSYKSFLQQFSVSLVVDDMLDQTNDVHTTITDGFLYNRYTSTHS